MIAAGLEKQIAVAWENMCWVKNILQREAKNVIWLQGCITIAVIHNFLQSYCCKKLSNFSIFTSFFLFLIEAYDSPMEEHFLLLILSNN